MKKRLFVIFEIVFFVAYLFSTIAIAEPPSAKKVKANEKLITIKGLSIGIDINAARKICEDLLGKDWIVSEIGARNELMADYQERARNDWLPISGKHGFLIKKKDGYAGGLGFVSDDEENGRVTRITFSGELIDYIYSAEGVHADYFVEDFRAHFGLPDLPWIRGGWQYSSPYGYVLTIMNDKSIDIKKRVTAKPLRPKIKFD